MGRWGVVAVMVMAAAGRAQAPENERIVLARQAVAPGGAAANARIRVQGAMEPVRALALPQSPDAAFYPGWLAPAADRVGLLTPRRVREMLIGLQPIIESTAFELAGNRDGRHDVADLVALVGRGIP